LESKRSWEYFPAPFLSFMINNIQKSYLPAEERFYIFLLVTTQEDRIQ